MASTKKQTPTPKPARTPIIVSKWIWMIAAVLITFMTLSPVLNNGFVNQDDNIYITDNPQLSKPLTESVPYFFGPHYYAGNYIPFTMLAYAFIYRLGDVAPGAYHAASLLLHTFNVALVFWLICLLSGRKKGVAFFVALLFGIHPMHVESVAWAAELKDVLYAACFLGGLIAYWYYIAAQAAADTRRYRLLAAVFALFILSLLAKPAAVVFPIVLLLLDYYLRRTPGRMMWLEKLPFLALSVVFGIIAIKAQRTDELVNDQYPLIQRCVFASYALLAYMGKFVLPFNMASFYPFPKVPAGHMPAMWYAAPAAVLLLCLAVYGMRRSRVVVFGMLFFAVTIALVLQVYSVGNAIMADRYTYIPYIGLLFIVGMGLAALRERRLRYWPSVTAVVACLAIAGAVAAHARCQQWADQDAMAEDLVELYPNDPIVLNNRGYMLQREGRYDDAIKLFRRAIKERPDFVKSDYVKPYMNLSETYLAMKRPDSAHQVVEAALKYAPRDHNVLNEMGIVLCMEGRIPEGIAWYNKTLALKKDDLNAYLNLLRAYYDLHDKDNWLRTADTGLKYIPGNYILLNSKGYCLYMKGEYMEAIKCLNAALDKKPDYEPAKGNLDNCYKALNGEGRKSGLNLHKPKRL